VTIEYILLLVVVFSIGLKSFMSAPKEAFMNSGPRLGARVEKHLVTGRGFSDIHKIKWDADRR
jgi:hypothetical protein